MTNERDIRQYTAADLERLRARGDSRTDLAKVRAKSEAELVRDIAADADFAAVPERWFEGARAMMPTPKKLLSLRLDADVVDWFRRQGPGYQTRINAVLKSFKTLHEKGSDPGSSA